MQTSSRVEQIVFQIRALIGEQTFIDDRLPSEPELARILKTSRTTIRQALAQLELDGLIVRKHGVGTFINQRVLNIGSRLEEVWDFVEMIEHSGFDPGVEHVSLALETVESQVANQLSLLPDAEVLKTTNIFLADGVPVIYCIDMIPAGLVRSAYRDEELHGPVYTFLEKRCRQHVEYNITRVLPVVADETLSHMLDCDLGAPLHYFEEVAFNADDLPIMYSEEYYRPEYFSFNIVRKMTAQGLE